MSNRVFIGVGHGGSDPGAAKYVREADVNLTIALELRRLLEAAGFEVGMSRTIDEDDTIYEEIREANAFGPDLAIEIHNNAGGGDGWECFIQTNQYAAQSRAAAEAIEAEVKAVGQNSRGLKTKVFGWTYNVKAPSILTEGFFVDNWNDAKDFDTVEEQKKLAGAYARGIFNYFGIDPDVKPEPEAVAFVITASGSVTAPSEAFAEEVAAEVRAFGFSVSLEKVAGSDPAPAVPLVKEGSIVKLKPGTTYYDGKTPKSFVYDRLHVAYEVTGNRVVIAYNGTIVGAVHKDDLELV